MPRNEGTASGEPRGASLVAGMKPTLALREMSLRLNCRWVVVRCRPMHFDLICRTAGYVTRTSGGVGGGGREAFPYPD